MQHVPKRSALCVLLTAVVVATASACAAPPGSSLSEVIDRTQSKMVKIYGAGGFRGMEAYASGMLISSDGHILSIWSYVLDTDYITVVLHDGRKYDAKLVGADPRLEVAVLKIEEEGLDCFDLSRATEVDAGARVLAFSNLYGVAAGSEPTSVQHGVVSVTTTLTARRGVF